MVILDIYDAEITAIIPFILLITGPPQRPGQLYTAKYPWANFVPINRSNYILCMKAQRDGETVYSFHADNSLFKRENWKRHRAQYSGYFNVLFFHYFYRVYKRNSLKTDAIPGLDPRLSSYRYACTDPSFKPYRAIGKDGMVTHRSDSSKVLLTAFRNAVDNLLGKGTSTSHHIDRINNVYATRVLTFAKNYTPGSVAHIFDLAISSGVLNKDEYVKNRAELEECAKIQEAIGLSGCQGQYDYRNGNALITHACNLFYAFKTVESMITADPTDHIIKMEELRQQRQLHPNCVPCFQPGQIPFNPSLTDAAAPEQTSPIVQTAIEDVVPFIEDLD